MREPPHPLRAVRQDPRVVGQRIDRVVQLRCELRPVAGTAWREVGEAPGERHPLVHPPCQQHRARQCDNAPGADPVEGHDGRVDHGISIGDITRSSMSLAVARRATIGTTKDVSAERDHPEIEHDVLATLQSKQQEHGDADDDGDADSFLRGFRPTVTGNDVVRSR